MKYLILTLSLFFLLSCVTLLDKNMNYQIPEGKEIKTKDLEISLVSAGRKKGWEFEKIEDQKFHGSLFVRSHYIKSEFTIGKKSLDIKYLDSKNMKYSGTTIHKKYKMWIDNLVISYRSQVLRKSLK